MDQDLRDYLDQQFSAINQRFNEVDRRFNEVDQRFNDVDRRFNEVDQRFNGVDQRFDRLETEVRGAWISIEDLRDKVQLVAEGVANNNERSDRNAEEVSRRFDDLESLIHQSYEDLDVRVRRLEAAG